LFLGGVTCCMVYGDVCWVWHRPPRGLHSYHRCTRLQCVMTRVWLWPPRLFRMHGDHRCTRHVSVARPCLTGQASAPARLAHPLLLHPLSIHGSEGQGEKTSQEGENRRQKAAEAQHCFQLCWCHGSGADAQSITGDVHATAADAAVGFAKPSRVSSDAAAGCPSGAEAFKWVLRVRCGILQ
jgi:hypothetical protein